MGWRSVRGNEVVRFANPAPLLFFEGQREVDCTASKNGTNANQWNLENLMIYLICQDIRAQHTIAIYIVLRNAQIVGVNAIPRKRRAIVLTSGHTRPTRRSIVCTQ